MCVSLSLDCKLCEGGLFITTGLSARTVSHTQCLVNIGIAPDVMAHTCNASIQEDLKFQASLGYTKKSCPQTNKGARDVAQWLRALVLS